VLIGQCNKTSNGILHDVLHRLHQGVLTFKPRTVSHYTNVISFTPTEKVQASPRRFFTKLIRGEKYYVQELLYRISPQSDSKCARNRNTFFHILN